MSDFDALEGHDPKLEDEATGKPDEKAEKVADKPPTTSTSSTVGKKVADSKD